jgi:hypothetical protein
MARWIEALRRDREQAESDLAALHAEAARLRAALDLAERDKAHAVAEQGRAEAERREAAQDAGRLIREKRTAEAERDAMRSVVEKAKVWRRHRNFEYRPGEINPHLLTAHQEDLDLAKAVDQMAPSGPRGEPQSDDRGEVAGTDTVEAQEGTRRVWRHRGCGYMSTPPLPVPCPSCGNDAEWVTAMNTAGPTPTIVATTMGAPLVVKHVV